METDPVTACDASTAIDSAEERAPLAYLVVVHKGPTWHQCDIEPFCRLLSRRFAGEIWAFGSYSADVVMGRIRLRVVAEQPLRDAVNLVRFVRQAHRWIEELRVARLSRLAFVSLEPFKGGLLGLYAAKRAHGVLICEVNGVYASHHNTADTARVLLRNMRVLMRRLIGSFVLRRATAIRLLFPEQLKGFARLPEQVISRQFFETSNLSIFHPGPEERIILGVGFPFRVKGFDVLCKAFKVIVNRYPGWRLVLIGYRVPEELRAGGFEHPSIEAYPGISHVEIAEWVARCAIFVLPSRTEAMGRVLLEAAAAGKCRVATKVDGIPTVVEDGVDGLLVEAEHMDQLAEALERLISDQGLRRRLGAAARSRVQQEFSNDAYLDHYTELVSAALQRGVR